MKRLNFTIGITCILIFSVLIMASAQSEKPKNNYPVLSKQVEVRGAQLKIAVKIIQVSMQETIDYFNELPSDKPSTAKLQSILTEINQLNNQIDSTDTHVGLNSIIKTMQLKVREFKSEKNRLMGQVNGKQSELNKRIIIVLSDHADEINSLTERYWAIRKSNSIEVLEKRIEFAQNILNILNNNRYDITQAQEKLDEINAKKDELSESLNKRDNVQIAKINVEILSLSNELRQIVIDLQIDIPEKTRVGYYVHLGNRIVPRIDSVISDLEDLGIEVTELKSLNEQAKSKLDEADTRFTSNNLEGTIQSLNELKDILKNVHAEIISIMNNNPNNSEIAEIIESAEDALDSAVNNMDENL